MKNAVFWDVTPRGSCKNRRFGDARCVRRLLVTANIVPSSPIHVTLIMEAIRSSETSALTRATRRHISEDAILQLNEMFMRPWFYANSAYEEITIIST
jgi:hypothetical protein